MGQVNISTDQSTSSALLEQRRQEAIVTAQQCINTLKQDFGASKVVLFGSLRGDSPWHWESDLDLAVQGLSEEAFWNAYAALEQIVPNWLRIDLVPLERVPAQVAARILETQSMPTNKYLALKAHLDDEMLALVSNTEKVQEVLAQVETVSDVIIVPALASYIADFYTGCERISERVAITLDKSLPGGKNWHRDLLKQVAEAGGDNRPPLWKGALLLDLDEYRKFRHLARHVYNIELQREKVLALAVDVRPLLSRIKPAIAEFQRWLDQQVNNLE